MLPGVSLTPYEILAVKNFNIEYKVAHMYEAFRNLFENGYDLADPKLGYDGKPIRGIIGCDLLQHFPQFEIVTCYGGSAFETRWGLVPFGDIDNFF